MRRSRNMECSGSNCFPIIGDMPMNTATHERVLVARCKAGDHAAFMELIRRSSPSALRAIRTIAPNPADVEDVMQDTVVNALRGLPSFNHRSKFSTWLTRIAINNALQLLRRRRNKIEISLDADGEKHDSTALRLADSRINPEQALIHAQSIEIVRRAVRALPTTLREYVEQCCLKELPHKDVARMLGISLSAGKSRSLRARQKLHSSLTSRREQSTINPHVNERNQPRNALFKHFRTPPKISSMLTPTRRALFDVVGIVCPGTGSRGLQKKQALSS
jgi:RNA polymerase sigma-70 factor, ECF subfamily